MGLNPSSFYMNQNLERPTTRGFWEARKFNFPKQNHHFSSEDDKLIWKAPIPGLSSKFENVIEE